MPHHAAFGETDASHSVAGKGRGGRDAQRDVSHSVVVGGGV